MSFAVFSDIHANLEALETAVSCAQGRGITRFAVLGDTIGYGADPNECLEWVFAHAAVNVYGNHERALVQPELREQFNSWAAEAIEWTAGILDPKLTQKIRELTFMRIEDGISFVHGSPDRPEEFRYLFNFGDCEDSFRQMQTDICFTGHTHVPCCFCEQKKSAEYLAPGKIVIPRLDRGIQHTDSRFRGNDVPLRVILNPGSVGQPRDRDPRLSFGIYDSEVRTFEIVRLDYDNQKAAAKIRRAGLPSFLADRLL